MKAVLLVIALMLSGCYSTEEQRDFAKRCLDAGLVPSVNDVDLQCHK